MSDSVKEPNVVAPDDLREPASRPRDVEEVRRRLIARGLLADAPAIAIPKEPRPAAPAAPAEDVDPMAEPHWAENPYDSWDVEPGLETTEVACPRCRTVVTVAVEATRVQCEACETNWRYAVCEQRHLQLTLERQESWRCHRCGTFRRSWWRTPSARMLALGVLARKREVLAEERRRQVREGMRLRRWKLVAFGVCAALATAVFVLVTRSSEPNVGTGRETACTHFREILEGISAGELTPSELDTELDELQQESEGEDADFGDPIAAMRGAESPTSSAFITARARLVDACGSDLGTG